MYAVYRRDVVDMLVGSVFKWPFWCLVKNYFIDIPPVYPSFITSKTKGPLLRLSKSEVVAVRNLIDGYRQSASFLHRSADELERLLKQCEAYCDDKADSTNETSQVKEEENTLDVKLEPELDKNEETSNGTKAIQSSESETRNSADTTTVITSTSAAKSPVSSSSSVPRDLCSYSSTAPNRDLCQRSSSELSHEQSSSTVQGRDLNEQSAPMEVDPVPIKTESVQPVPGLLHLRSSESSETITKLVRTVASASPVLVERLHSPSMHAPRAQHSPPKHDHSPSISQYQAQQTPAISEYQSPHSPPITQYQSQPSPTITRIPQYQSQHSPSITQYQSQHSPSITQYQSQHSPSITQYPTQHSPSITQYQTQHSPAITQYQTQHTSSATQYQTQHSSINPYQTQPQNIHHHKQIMMPQNHSHSIHVRPSQQLSSLPSPQQHGNLPLQQHRGNLPLQQHGGPPQQHDGPPQQQQSLVALSHSPLLSPSQSSIYAQKIYPTRQGVQQQGRHQHQHVPQSRHLHPTTYHQVGGHHQTIFNFDTSSPQLLEPRQTHVHIQRSSPMPYHSVMSPVSSPHLQELSRQTHLHDAVRQMDARHTQDINHQVHEINRQALSDYQHGHNMVFESHQSH